MLLLIAYALPAFGVVVPASVSMAVCLACIPLGAVGLAKVLTFRDYRGINKELLSGLTNQMDSQVAVQIVKQASEKKISADTSISSNRKGFEYLNELFIKRHQKDPLGFARKRFLAYARSSSPRCWWEFICCRKNKPAINEIVMTWLPYFVFIHVCHQPRHEFYPGAVYELRPQPADLLVL